MFNFVECTRAWAPIRPQKLIVIECYGNSLLKKYASVSDLKNRMSRVEEWLRQVEGKDNEKSVRKEARKLS